jgi:hypothetical protein
MSTIAATSHAKYRLQNRSIPEHAIELLMQFGTAARSHNADRLFFDKSSRRRVKREVDANTFRMCERYMNTYVVVSDTGFVITAGHRTKRFKRN